MPLYLLVVEYSSEAERKRLEYLLSTFKGRIAARRPSGSIVVVEGEQGDVESLLENLYSRIPSHEVSVYRLSSAALSIEPRKAILEVDSELTPGEFLGAVSAIMAEMRALSAGKGDSAREYIVPVKGGRITVRVEAVNGSGSSKVIIGVEGYGNAFNAGWPSYPQG